MLHIISANLNGIRSAARKGFFDWVAHQDADAICVQELKAQAGDMTPAMLNPGPYRGYFHYADKKGYSGVGLYTRHPPDRVTQGIGHSDFDAEGRYVQADFGDLSIVSVYVPSGSSSAERQQVKFRFLEVFYPHLAALARSGRAVIMCGDWNIAHREIDLKNWKNNQNNSGFLPEERRWLSQVLDEAGWVDVYRRLHPDATGESYTWWSNRGQARANNVGWRIDYHMATPQVAQTATRASVYKGERFSDHAPLSVCYDWAIRPGTAPTEASTRHA